MQFTVERDALLRELSRVTGVIERKSAIPILGNVYLAAEGSHVRLRAMDLDIQAEAPCPAEVAIAGATTVEGRLLHDAVKRASEGSTIALKIDPKRCRLVFSAGRSRIEMPVLPAEDHPTLDLRARDDNRSFLMDAADLRSIIEAARFALSTERTRPYLCGLYLHQLGEQLTGVATDGHRLSVKHVPLPAQAEGMAGVILPRKLMSELLRCLPEKGEIALEVCSNRVVVTAAEFRIVSKLIAGTYPDWQRVMPKVSHSCTVDRKRTIEALERVTLIAEKGNEAVQLDMLADGARLSCQGQTRGRACDEFDAVVDGPATSIGINAGYLRDCLGAASGERLVIGYADASTAILIRAERDEEMTHRMVVMPMRVPGIQMEREAA